MLVPKAREIPESYIVLYWDEHQELDTVPKTQNVRRIVGAICPRLVQIAPARIIGRSTNPSGTNPASTITSGISSCQRWLNLSPFGINYEKSGANCPRSGANWPSWGKLPQGFWSRFEFPQIRSEWPKYSINDGNNEKNKILIFWIF